MNNKRHISPTQLGMLSGTGCCPWKWHARYELKLEAVKGEALLIGKAFDGLVGCFLLRREASLDTGLDDKTLELIKKRFEEYQPHIPLGKPQVHIEIDLGYNDWWVQGFVDILPLDDGEPFREVKMGTRAWERKKVGYYRHQIITYSKALDFRPGQFDVKNMDDDSLQTFGVSDYCRKGRSPEDEWEATRKEYLKAIKIIESDDREPRENILCGGTNKHGDSWECDFWNQCPLRQKEQRIKEIADEYF